MKEIVQADVCKKMTAVIIGGEIAYYRCSVTGGFPRCHRRAWDKDFLDRNDCKDWE